MTEAFDSINERLDAKKEFYSILVAAPAKRLHKYFSIAAEKSLGSQ